MLRKTLDSSAFEFKSSQDGSFEGYASVFSEVDSYKQATDPGSFTESLSRIKESGRPLPLLWQHDTTKPIGTFTDLAEDSKGLHVKGKLLLDVQQGREAKSLIEAGAVSGLSIGYFVKGERFDQKTGVLHLTNIDLVEISAVTMPAGPGARITSIKSLTPDEVYDALRDGTLPRLSNREAKKFMAAWRALERDDEPEAPNPEQLATLAAQMKNFTKIYK